MKAMILAAGRGERMRPLTDNCPKPLLEVGGQRLIEYHLQQLARAGFHDIVINTARLGELFPEYLGDGSRYGVRLHFSHEGAGALETAGGIIHALPLLDSEVFLVVNGDIWTDFNYATLPDKLRGSAHLVLVDNPRHHPAGDFQLTPEGHVIDKPGLTFSGIGLYARELFTPFETQVKPLAPLLRAAMTRDAVTGQYYSGQWWDIGTPQRLQELNDYLLQTGKGA
jgi:MurNAc alpha-1-phosphate uridylyltransferase